MQYEPSFLGTLPAPVNPIKIGFKGMAGYQIRRLKNILLASKPNDIFQPFDIINNDERIEIEDTIVYPYRCICYLKITYPNGDIGLGTGWLVSRRAVITAGHCIYDSKSGGTAREIEIIPAARGQEIVPYGKLISKQFDYRLQSSRIDDDPLASGFDFGVIFLSEDCDLGEKLGYFGFADLNTDELIRRSICISGYPDDKTPGTQWHHHRRILQATDTRLSYQVDTYKGQSGSPIWFDENKEQYLVVGIHNSGYDDPDDKYNFGTRINDSIYNTIKTWREQGS